MRIRSLRATGLVTSVGIAILAACTGSLGDDVAGPPTDTGSRADGGPSSSCDAATTALQRDVGAYLETTCAHAGCHLPIGPRSPSFAAADLDALVASGAAGRILVRMDPADPSQIMPPSRAVNSAEEIDLVRRWVTAGMPTGCVPPPPRPAADPNALDQGALFTCADPSTAPPGPRRARRVGSPEWVHAAGGTLLDRSMLANPWASTSGPYSTFTAGESVDAPAMLLYLDTLSAMHGQLGWFHNERANLAAHGYSIECAEILSASVPRTSEPDDACRDAVVDATLRIALGQTPSSEAHTELRAYFDRLLVDATAELVADPSLALAPRRERVLEDLFDAAFVSFGALHRPEGTSVGRLSTDEVGIALASALSTQLPTGLQRDRYPRHELAWIPGFRSAQAAGTLATDAQVRAYVENLFDVHQGYWAGTSSPDLAYRPDLQSDYSRSLGIPNARRGEYWLAPRVASFFREYFAYGGVATVAKDDAGETSRWDLGYGTMGDGGVGTAYDAVAIGQDVLGAGTDSEPGLVDELDDAIARMVVEAEQSGGDVFRALLTGRVFRVPAVRYDLARPLTSGAACDPRTCVNCCASPRDVCFLESFAADGTPQGHCTDYYGADRFHWARVYDVNVPIMEDPAAYPPTSAPWTDAVLLQLMADPAHAARWVTMPASDRAGVLTHPTWLAAHGGNAENDPSIIHRGRWIREHLFCESVAGLDLVQLDASLPPSETLSARHRLEMAMGPSGDVRCANAACHGQMNSLGEPFEIYNHAGFLRATDHGSAPDGHALITNWPGRADVMVDDAVDLASELAADPYARRCFLRHVFRYFMGRYETANDACTLAAMEAAFAGGSLGSALAALYASPTFLVRADLPESP